MNDTEAFREIRDELLSKACPQRSDIAVDLGAGTGFVTLPLSERVERVVAVDLSEAMLAKMVAGAPGDANIVVVSADIAQVDFPPSSVDLVVSNYALHHLTDDQKAGLADRALQWLRPGGRMVVADMMFGRGMSRRDRSIARSKIRALARRGPGGLWRIAKNLVRFSLRVGIERPIPPGRWADVLSSAGFTDVSTTELPAEAGLVVGRKLVATAGPR